MSENLDAKTRRFHTIKRKGGDGGMELAWAEPLGGDWVKRSIEDPHPATDAFNGAFDNIAPFINGPCGHTAAQAQQLRVTCVLFKYSKKGSVTAELCAIRPLEGYTKPLNVNLHEVAPAGELQKALDDLAFEAEEYLDGKKGQLELDLDGEDGE